MRKRIATESVRINGTWRVVDIWVDTLALACKLGPKAAKNPANKVGARTTKLGGGHIAIIVRAAS